MKKRANEIKLQIRAAVNLNNITTKIKLRQKQLTCICYINICNTCGTKAYFDLKMYPRK